MRPSADLLGRLPPFTEADAFFCFIRSWWDGAGIDAGIWWRDSSGCFRRLLKTGETIEHRPPLIDRQESIDPVDFSAILDDVVRLGLGSIPQQPNRVIFSHYDDWFGMKPDRGGAEHWLQIAGGKHADPRAMHLLDKVWDQLPSLFAEFSR